MRFIVLPSGLKCVGRDGSFSQAPMPYAKVFNVETGQQITHCLDADDETGDYERFVTDVDGSIVIWPEGPRTEFGKAPLHIVFTNKPGENRCAWPVWTAPLIERN